jgi:hypothetical protein
MATLESGDTARKSPVHTLYLTATLVRAPLPSRCLVGCLVAA